MLDKRPQPRTDTRALRAPRGAAAPASVRGVAPRVTDRVKTTPRLALSRAEAAASMGMSLDSFERYCQGEIPCIRRGRLRLYPLRELERWLERNAERVLEEGR